MIARQKSVVWLAETETTGKVVPVVDVALPQGLGALAEDVGVGGAHVGDESREKSGDEFSLATAPSDVFGQTGQVYFSLIGACTVFINWLMKMV